MTLTLKLNVTKSLRILVMSKSKVRICVQCVTRGLDTSITLQSTAESTLEIVCIHVENVGNSFSISTICVSI